MPGNTDLSESHRYSEILTIKSFGAIGDGVVDDTVSLQKAFNASSGKILVIEPGIYKFTNHLEGPSNCNLICKGSAVFMPTWQPRGKERRRALIKFGEGCEIDSLMLDLPSGVNTVRIGVELSSRTKLGFFSASSVDLNNNRMESGSTDLISGALVIRGENISIGQVEITRFDRSLCFVDCNYLVIDSVRHLETIMGVYGHGSRNVHIRNAYTTSPKKLAEVNELGRGVMTPGANSLLLAGVSDSIFENWLSFDALEHGIRIGTRQFGTTVFNERLKFRNIQIYRPYGCGFKMDDNEKRNIRKIRIIDLYTEDVGNGNWFGTPNFLNWSANSKNNLRLNNDGNKVGLAIRNSEEVTVAGYISRKKFQAHSGYFGLWIEKSRKIDASRIDVCFTKIAGIVIQSGSGVPMMDISLRHVKTHANGKKGLWLRPTNNSDRWHGVSVIDINAISNREQDVSVDSRPDGTSPYFIEASKIEGYARDAIIASSVANDKDFINNLKTKINDPE